VALINTFGANQRLSDQSAAEIPEVIKRFFSDVLTITPVPAAASVAQKVGLDVTVLLASGRLITIDFKIRKPDYHDILFEYGIYEANGEFTAGYVNKSHLRNDFLLSYFQDSKRAELLEMGVYRQLWQIYGSVWVRKGMFGERGFSHKMSAARSGRDGKIYTRYLVTVPRSEYFSRMMELGEKR
jgi:hypothetical protein